jgi:transcriptional/translational regulatory protein YebC/TACO1
VRSTFTRHGSSLGESGCVAWLFDSKGVITIKAESVDADELALTAIDAGAEDVKIENNYVEVYTKPEELEAVRKTLEQKNLPIDTSELSMVPKTLVPLDEKAALQALKLLNKLEEIDDVQNVFSNADIPDAIMESYQSQ